MDWTLVAVVFSGLFILVLAHDLLQRKKAILHNFPVIGHLRYLLIEIGPEIRQYIVAHNREEAPFNRLERDWIYHSADRKNNYFGFGTDDQIYGIGYPIIKHATLPKDAVDSHLEHHGAVEIPCAKVIGAAHRREKPYRPPSIINISAMSFGSLGRNAISALNRGATLAGCFHNTGEGGCSPYHRHGSDICYQIGTGYFGVRDMEGNFSLEKAQALVEEVPQIRLFEVKLSQGAKPGKGGVLPKEKITPEIATIRGIPEDKDCLSPANHTAFSDVDSMIDFIEMLAQGTGRPVGIKAAIGHLDFFYQLAERMKARGEGPDFITIDGGEGGTGAAPLTFADHVALPYKLGFTRVYKIFLEAGLTDDIVFVGSGKLGFPDRSIVAMALGADLVSVAREAMLSIGCIQAQKCHTGGCPAGVATHNPWLQRGLDPEVNAKRFQAYIETFRKEVAMVTRAAGYRHPGQFTGHDIEMSSGPGQFSTLNELFGYSTKQYLPGHEPTEKVPTREEEARLAGRLPRRV